MSVTAYNVTTKSYPVFVKYQFQFAYPQLNVTPNRGKFAIYNFGGTQLVNSLTVSSQAPIGADLMIVGDSKTVPYFAGVYTNGFGVIMQSYMRTTIDGNRLWGDGGCSSSSLPEIISLKPKSVILNIGRNDIVIGSIPFATYSANYASIVTQLQTAGIVVYHLLPLYEPAGVNQTPLTNFINSTYPAANIIDSGLQNYAASNTTILAGDLVHPNALGNQIIAQAIIDKFIAARKPFSYMPVSPLTIVTSFTTTAATSDLIAVPGMTPYGHCVLQRNKCTSWNDIAGTYISAKAGEFSNGNSYCRRSHELRPFV